MSKISLGLSINKIVLQMSYYYNKSTKWHRWDLKSRFSFWRVLNLFCTWDVEKGGKLLFFFSFTFHCFPMNNSVKVLTQKNKKRQIRLFKFRLLPHCLVLNGKKLNYWYHFEQSSWLGEYCSLSNIRYGLKHSATGFSFANAHPQ